MVMKHHVVLCVYSQYQLHITHGHRDHVNSCGGLTNLDFISIEVIIKHVILCGFIAKSILFF